MLHVPASAGFPFNRLRKMKSTAFVGLGCITLLLLLSPATLTAGPLFQKAQVFRSGALTANDVAVGDLNGDGNPDLVAVNDCYSHSNCRSGQVAVLLGNGDGTFQPATLFDTGHAFAGSLTLADFNADGKLDVAATTGGSCPPNNCGYVAVMLGNGDGSFRTPSIYASGGDAPRNVESADVNGDGIVDLIVANGWMDFSVTEDGGVGVLLGKGDGTFVPAQSFDSGFSTLMSVAVADVNGDDNLDLLTLHAFARIGVSLGNGDGTFQTAQTISSGGIVAMSFTVADVNTDGKPDILAVTAGLTSTPGIQVGVLLGNGDGSFQAPQNFLTGRREPTSIAVADINGDGNLDLLVTHTCGRNPCNSAIVVFLGAGDGTFKLAPTVYSGARHANSIVAADLNGDKKPDLIVANSCFTYLDCSSGSVSVLMGLSGVRTSSTLVSDLNPSLYGQNVNFTATVTTTGPSAPTGKVNFTWQGHSIGTALLNAFGVATLSKRNLNAASYPLTAVYVGDPANASSTSPIVNQIVRQTRSAASISSSLNPATVGQLVTFIATITSPTVLPSGPVTFTAGNVVLGTAQLKSNGRAVFSTSSLPVGSTKITATYAGDSNIARSSASLSETVH